MTEKDQGHVSRFDCGTRTGDQGAPYVCIKELQRYGLIDLGKVMRTDLVANLRREMQVLGSRDLEESMVMQLQPKREGKGPVAFSRVRKTKD